MLIAVRTLGLLLALAPLAAATDAAMIELIMPDARVVGGIDFSRLRSSPMGDVLRIGMQNGIRQAGGADVQKIFDQLGFDPFQDIEEILLASTGAGKNPPSLVVIRGNARVRGLLESSGARFKTGPNALTTVGDLVLTGDAAQVKAASLRRGRGPAVSLALGKRISEMRSKYDVWVLSTVPLSSLAANMNDAKSQGFAGMDALKSIEQFSLGLGMSSDFMLNIEVVTRDSKAAGALADSVQMLLAMAKQSAGKDPSALDALKRMNFGVQGRVLHLGLTVPAEEMKKQMETLKAQAQSGAFVPGQAPVRGGGATRHTPAQERPQIPPNADLVIQSSPKDMGTVVISGSKK